MSSTPQKELRGCLNKFIANAKKELGDDLTYKNLYSFVKIYLESESIDHTKEPVKKKSSRKHTTEPGDIFDASLCQCRVWNGGFGKQCSNKPKEGKEVCGLHQNSIDKYGGWSLGMYFDKQSSTHLYDGGGNTKKGDKLPWKDYKDLSNKKSSGIKTQDPKVMRLKDKYEQHFGKRPRGPKASDINWLRFKLDISSDDSDSDDSSDEEEINVRNQPKSESDDESDEEKDDKEKETVKKLENNVKINQFFYNEIKYDGVLYFKCTEINKEKDDSYEILNDDEDIVGWMKNEIITFDDGYDEIHEDHEDYRP